MVLPMLAQIVTDPSVPTIPVTDVVLGIPATFWNAVFALVVILATLYSKSKDRKIAKEQHEAAQQIRVDASISADEKLDEIKQEIAKK